MDVSSDAVRVMPVKVPDRVFCASHQAGDSGRH